MAPMQITARTGSDAPEELGLSRAASTHRYGITLRQFTDFYCEKVPKHDAFNGNFNRLNDAQGRQRPRRRNR
jgi:hypothetical protein